VRISTRRPAPPRDPHFDATLNQVSWTPPTDTALITHYRLRIGRERAQVSYQPAIGQTSVQCGPGVTRLFLSSYNQTTDTESELVLLDMDSGGAFLTDDVIAFIEAAHAPAPSGGGGTVPAEGEFSFQTDWVVENPGIPVAACNFSVDITQSQRVNFCYTAKPVIADTGLVINVIISSDFGASWDVLETLTIAAGAQTSWGGQPDPWNQTTPYSGAAPFRTLKAGDLLNFTVESGYATGLTIKLDTNANG
jgi:hypothetical protein